MRIAVLVLAGACAHQVHPVAPSVSLHYSDVDPRQSDQPEVRREVIVGRAITVNGTFAATCAESKKPLLADSDKYYGTDYVRCKEEGTQVVLACSGACSVSGNVVTPTGEGTFTLTIDLTSKQHHHTETRTFVAKLADHLRIENCAEGPRLIEAAPWPRCTLDGGAFVVRVMAAGNDLGLPVTVRNGDREVTGNTFLVTQIIGTTPSGAVAPGEYDVDLRYGTLEGRARIVIR